MESLGAGARPLAEAFHAAHLRTAPGADERNRRLVRIPREVLDERAVEHDV
jgi:hypothetical protein